MDNFRKKYNESMEKMSIVLKKYSDIIAEDGEIYKDLLNVFPEMKKSENYKVINALKHLVKSNKELSFGIDNYDGVKWERILSWIEKQETHTKFINSIQIGDKVTRNQDGVLVNLSQLGRKARIV